MLLILKTNKYLVQLELWIQKLVLWNVNGA